MEVAGVLKGCKKVVKQVKRSPWINAVVFSGLFC
jgi:hypothetical protein